MIFTTITLNPCLDRREYLEEFRLGSTNRPYKTTVSAGGKGINVSKELLKLVTREESFLDTRINTVTFVGGKTGEVFKEQLFRELFPDEGVCGVTLLPSSFETRVCTKLITPEGVSEINGEGRLSEKEISLLAEAVADIVGISSPQVVFLCGSFPQGVDNIVENSLITLLESCGIPVIVDTSGNALVESLVGSPSLIKPNENEIFELYGGEIESEEKLVEFLKSLYVDNSCEVLCTLGEKGAVFVGKEGVFKVRSQRISPCDPTGAGDAFLAAFAYGKYGKGMRAKEALAFADGYVREKLIESLK